MRQLKEEIEKREVEESKKEQTGQKKEEGKDSGSSKLYPVLYSK